MRGKKASLYDGGHRVPCFVRWPAGGVAGGRDVCGLTRSTDVLPTLIDLCSLHIADGLTFDGISLASSLHRGDEPSRDRLAVVQYGHANDGIWGHTEKYKAAVLWCQWRLVNGVELYDMRTDAGQTQDVSDSNPNVVSRMRDYYEGWWAATGDTLHVYQPLRIGAPQENPVRLCSCDWAWVYADNQSNIRGCVMDSGTWHVDVARAGLYSFTLRRWPEESGLGVSAPAPFMQGVDGTFPEGVALPVASAWLRAGNGEWTQPVSEGATHVTFRMELEHGPAEVKSWWYDAGGNTLAGAYYLTAERLSR